jgi:hypothetical protein
VELHELEEAERLKIDDVFAKEEERGGGET